MMGFGLRLLRGYPFGISGELLKVPNAPLA